MKSKASETIKSITISLLTTLLTFVILFLSFAWALQPEMFFHPWHDTNSYDRLSANSSFQEVVIENSDIELHGWLKKNNLSETAPLVIFYGGNAQNSSNTCATFLDQNKYKYFGEYNLLVVDYPGYGLSEGVPSDDSMFDAALAIYDYASKLKCVNADKIIVMGYSIGTGSATYVASQRDVDGLILVAPYDCALSLYNEVLNIFHGPLKLLARYEFNSVYYATNVTTKPLIITSKADEVIDYTLSLNLSKTFENEPELLLLDDVWHNDYFVYDIMWENIENYLKEREN